MDSAGVVGRVVIVGQGYVGLPLAMRAVEVGHTVVGFDVDDGRVKRLASGEPQVEDVPAEQLAAAFGTDRYQVTSRAASCDGFDVAVIAVPTPLADGVPDLSHIEGAGRALAPHVRPGSTVVLESTTYPGTTEELLVPILEAGSGLDAGADFHVGYSPERIDPGNRVWTLVNTPKVVSGIDAASLAAVRAFYETIVDDVVVVSSPKEAELTKLLENTFRHVNVALVNEIAMFGHDLGIDVHQAIDAATTKPFGFMRFEPGPGVGGHCLPIDPSYLSWRVRRYLGQPFRFVELANDINDHMPDYVVRRLVVALNRRERAVNGSRVLLLGVAYKRNTSDARESPAVRVVQQLLTLGAAVRVADPYVADRQLDSKVVLVEPSPDELAAADAVVLLTDHDTFDYDAIGRHARYVLDTRNRMHGETVEHL
ncbi:MAG: nucleotide sugar dehydrogenase [Acidimicrobiia bacterium]